MIVALAKSIRFVQPKSFGVIIAEARIAPQSMIDALSAKAALAKNEAPAPALAQPTARVNIEGALWVAVEEQQHRAGSV